jgi:hypothetical protein
VVSVLTPKHLQAQERQTEKQKLTQELNKVKLRVMCWLHVAQPRRASQMWSLNSTYGKALSNFKTNCAGHEDQLGELTRTFVMVAWCVLLLPSKHQVALPCVDVMCPERVKNLQRDLDEERATNAHLQREVAELRNVQVTTITDPPAERSIELDLASQACIEDSDPIVPTSTALHHYARCCKVFTQEILHSANRFRDPAEGRNHCPTICRRA